MLFLQPFEYLVCNLAYGIDVEETEAEIAAFKESHAELIERNKKKLDEDQIWIMQNLKEDRDMKNRVDQAHNQENKEVERSAVKDTKAIMEELRESNVPAEVILDRERKRQIEQELEEKEEAARRKKRNKEILQDRKRMAESMSFSTSQRMSGRAFEYKPPRLLINGPPIPSKEELETKGYLQHIRAASLSDCIIFSCIDVSCHDQVADATATQLCLAVADLYIQAAPNAPNFLHDAATECAVSALVRAEDHHAHQALAMSLQAAVYQLHGAFNQAVAMEDMDKSVLSYRKVLTLS
ncbi:CDK-activating kinase assembly factor MAT1 [Teladorsagia circumcincta]|uniref:CDK-activating kinase assembly factor MAT1 n=1 Tax=Teladorsagia circumcincta TaxID=45464 RepID=A0A2G9UBL1_TELCI|nr:CDK-activating kinase assembly factor MAT1 [Teladorsagia circumcincta]